MRKSKQTDNSMVGGSHPSVHGDVAFEPSMSALSVLPAGEFDGALLMLCFRVREVE